MTLEGQDHDELIFLHLSDIHFVKNFSGESKYDLDASLRHALEQDIEKLMDHIDHVDGILISGDIAFGGKVEEYETARTWLKKLAEILGCDPGYVWSVPGNHDIDQSVQKDMSILLDTYEMLRKSKKLDDDLHEKLTGKLDGPLMFQPLKNYHEQFGMKYGCPTSPREPWWEDELPLNDGSALRIRGMNSAIISSAKDHRDTAKLILGSAQTEYKPEKNIVYLTLCHHPPDWLLDGENAHEAMVAHSNLQFFGHKHSHRHEKIFERLRLYSGAVHPVRSEKHWDPRYYFVGLKVESSAESRELVVKLYPRVWSNTDRIFVRAAGDFEGLFLTERLKLPQWRREIELASTAPVVAADASAPAATPLNMTLNRKKLVNRFMALPYHAQVSIMQEFNLFTDVEKASLPDTELFIACFQRAREKNVLDQLWDAIDSETRKGN
ncbi:MAG TPA: metallophosphoesterase [Candidatus Angelobacter sp.]|jgi:predicted MPP superfamily phosphohydrolase